MTPSPSSLGRAIHDARKKQGFTQAHLATAAGYGRGGAISISRIESGHATPPPERLALIAAALGTTSAALHAAAARTSKGDASRPVREWADTLRATAEARTKRVTDSGTAYNSAEIDAREQFERPFREAASHISGAPPPPRTTSLSTVQVESLSPEEVLAVANATVRTLLPGSPLAAAWPSIRALAGPGAGALPVGGAAAVAAIALPGVIGLLAIGSLLLARRTKQQEDALRAKLVEVHADQVASEPAFGAMTRLVDRATDVLGYIALHGGHAVERWTRNLPDDRRWTRLSEHQRQTYDAFVGLLACQAVITSIPFEAIGAARGEALVELDCHYDALIDAAGQSARQYV